MALDFTALLCDQNCDLLKVIDTTGSYNASTNVGGYEAPNTALSDITGASLSIELSNGTVLGPIDIFNSSTQIPTNPGVEFSLDKDTMGGSLVDGLAKATFTLTGSGFEIQKELLFFITCTAKCCVMKLSQGINPHDKCADGSAASVFNRASRKLMEIKWLANECCNFTGAQAVLENLQTLCRENNCKTC